MAAVEKKIALLEQRLVLMERFVEMRFSETFRDFSIRNLSCAVGVTGGGLSSLSVSAVEDSQSNNQTSADKVDNRPTTRSSNSGKTKVPLPPASEEIPSTSAGKRELRIRVIRLDKNGGGDQDNLEETQTEPQPPHLMKISREDEDEVDFEEEIGGDQENDDYFMFTGGEVDMEDAEGDEVDDPLGANAGDLDDQDWREPSKKKRRSRARASRIRKPITPSSCRLPPGGIKLVNGKSPANLLECPVCHSHWKTQENYNKHLETCKKERTMKCRFEKCGKRFLTRKAVRTHEKLHEREKYEKMCRVGGGCEVKMVNPSHLLEHERSCIRKLLGKGGNVDEGVLEDVKRRSQNFDVTLKPSQISKRDGGGGGDLKSCRYCEEKVDKKEYLKHLDKHRTWKCGICVGGGDGGEGEQDGELSKAFVEKRSLVRHMVRVHGFSSKKANDNAVMDEEEGGGEVGSGEQGGGTEEEEGGEEEGILGEGQEVVAVEEEPFGEWVDVMT